ncbi:MAG: flagellar biosynthetic protein FliO [Bryobacteraceae bacterium]|nr:flagellar biosynthetic protein FliO [Bryobacteraceae bacterium]
MEPFPIWNAALLLTALAAGAVWLWIRGRGLPGFRGQRPRGPMEVVQRLPLTAQHSLHLVRSGEETLWVVTYPGGAVLHRAAGFSGYLNAASFRQEAGNQ